MTSKELEQLYRRYGASLHRRCRAIVYDASMADDAVHEVFVRLMRYDPNLADGVSALAWLNRAAERCCFDLLRKRRPREVPTDPPALDASVPYDPVEQRISDRDLVMRFWHRLGTRLRTVATGYYVDGLSQDELAQHLGRTRRTVYSDLKRIEQAARRFRASLRSPR